MPHLLQRSSVSAYLRLRRRPHDMSSLPSQTQKLPNMQNAISTSRNAKSQVRTEDKGFLSVFVVLLVTLLFNSAFDNRCFFLIFSNLQTLFCGEITGGAYTDCLVSLLNCTFLLHFQKKPQHHKYLVSPGSFTVFKNYRSY